MATTTTTPTTEAPSRIRLTHPCAVEDALETALRAISRNLVTYAKQQVSFSTATKKDEEIKRAALSLAGTHAEVAEQIEAFLEGKRRHPSLPNFPADFARYNYMSFTALLPRMLAELKDRHERLAKTRNALLEAIKEAQDAAALLTAAKVATEKAVEKLNAQAAGVTEPVSLAKDPPDVAPLVPKVKIVELVEAVGVPGVAIAAPAAAAAHDDHGHDEHADDHGHAEPHDDHGHGAAPAATATAEAPAAAAAAPAANAPEPAKPAAPAAEPEAPKEKSPEEQDAEFKATWSVAPLAPLAGDKTNFALAASTADAGQLEKLAHDANHLVRHNVVTNAATPKNIIEGMKGDPSYYVRTAASKR
jgi:hypothetical protein